MDSAQLLHSTMVTRSWKSADILPGMEKLQRSMNVYMKAVSKRSEVEGKEKTLPVAYLGGTMVSHGDDFEPDSEFGQCLTSKCTIYCP